MQTINKFTMVSMVIIFRPNPVYVVYGIFLKGGALRRFLAHFAWQL